MKKSFLQSCGMIVSFCLLCFSFTPVSLAEDYHRSVGELMMLASGTKSFNGFVDPAFTPEDIAIGDEALSYGDPEFEPYGSRMVFQDRLSNNSIWVDFLNPETGEFGTKDGKNILVDTGVAPLKNSRQGPEWGVSKEGSALFYSKKDAKGIMQIWRATFEDSKIRTQQLTHSRQNMYGVFASQSPGSDSIKIACIQGEVATGSAVWFDENTPMDITILPNAYFWVKSFRFCPDARYLFYSYQSSRNKYEKGKAQLAMMDTTSKQVKILTNDPGNKDEPCPFIAPEFGHELCVASTVDNEKIAIYRDMKDPSSFWTKVAEIEMPEESKHPFMHSLELVQAENRNFQCSYFATVAYPDNEGDGKSVREDGSLWLFGLGDHLARRVDQAMPGHKLEPEIWLGKQEVFFYYSFIDLDKNPNIALLRRCKTGLSTLLRYSHANQELFQ